MLRSLCPVRELACRVVAALMLCFANLLTAQQPPTASSHQVPDPTSTPRRRLPARRALDRIVIDGVLDERTWQTAALASDFVQVRPDYVPSTAFPSVVRVAYDAQHLYVAAFNRDSLGLRALRLPDLRRDFESGESDLFGVTIGSLGDRRTSYQFQVSPYGSLADVQAFDGGDAVNFSWDALWRARTTRSDSGWTAEIAIPWASLRYLRSGEAWDVNFVRNARRAAQWSAWSPYPRQFSSWRLAYAGLLDSVQPPPPRTNLRVRPYALGQTAWQPTGATRQRSTGDIGGEVIWAPTANSLVEATVNTDFAQADVDRQVVNLTRFSVFFPERRQFFLENSDLLSAGGLTGRYVVQPFFSRRIGLDDAGDPIAITGGARYAYRTGRASTGALLMRQAGTASEGAATFGVVRGSRFWGRSTRVGATVAVRSDDALERVSQTSANPLAIQAATDSDAINSDVSVPGRTNVVTAVDALGRIGEQIQFNGMVSTSKEDGRTGVAATYFAGRDSPTLYTGILGALVTRDYTPRTGFVSRPNTLVTSPAAALTLQPSWRPRSIVWFRPGVTTYFYQDPSSLRLQEGIIAGRVDVLYRSAASFQPIAELNLQRPDLPVTLFPNVVVPAGRHDTWRLGVDGKTDQSARLAATANLTTGGFFDGELDRALVTGRWSPNPFVALRLTYEVNRFRGLGSSDSSFTTHLAAPELRLSLNPRVQWSAFYQYNTAIDRGTLNARFSWEFAPLSFLYVVYNERRTVRSGIDPTAQSLIVKLSWLRQL